MRYIADLHIHSPFSRATSKASHLQGLAAWAAVKGIQVVGTGDFTHPGWQRQITENLVEAEPGFFRLQPERCDVPDQVLPPGLQADVTTVRFVLTAEISSIYKRGGQVRKVHNILFAPDLASVRRINSVLAGIGNIEADGRPILGLDSRDLLEILLEEAPQGFLVPAHVWTPWFSLFGSKSGFDAIEECFADLSDQVFALETGLSSDPDMNRLVSALDRFTLISNSDCHSPAKLGREANILDTGFDFPSLRDALRRPVSENGEQHFAATIEFYPEEGKYHGDGHRKCGVSLDPAESRKLKGLCPVCQRPLTVGVLSRVMELADRDVPVYPPGAPKVHSLIPLTELLGEMLGTGPASKRVAEAYVRLVQRFGSEFALLLHVAADEIAHETSSHLAEAIARMRSGRVIRTAGYDGEYGVIRVFSDEERKGFGGQRNLFGPVIAARPTAVRRTRSEKVRDKGGKVAGGAAAILNPEQEAAVVSGAMHILVKAGPGTGKTHTLVQRVVRLVREKQGQCTVITFTNRTADELRERLGVALGADMPVFVATLHGYCLHWLRRENPGLQVAGPDRRRWKMRALHPAADTEELIALLGQVQDFLRDSAGSLSMPPAIAGYFARLTAEGFVDIDQVVPAALAMLQGGGETARKMRTETGHLLVDEFQDLNEGQYQLIRLLAETSPVFAIGDPDQAIYGFRGSSPRWFYSFARDLGAEQHQLWRNYRSGGAIVKAAATLITQNSHPDPQVRNEAVGPGPGCLHLLAEGSPAGEAAAIVRQIEILIGGSSHREVERLDGAGGNVALSDIAVLYRTGRQAEIIASALGEHGFPVQVVDIVPFYLAAQVYPLTLWVWLAAGQSEAQHLLSLLLLEPGIGRAALARLEQATAGREGDPLDMLAACQEELPIPVQRAVTEMSGLRTRLRETARMAGVGAALRLVIARYGLAEEKEEIARLLRIAENFGDSFARFGDHLRRYSDSVVYDSRADAVTLMTLHASKGLEFRVAFIAGAEEGLLPLAPRKELAAEKEAEHIEEERRLCYVGMTRAREILFICHARSRSIDGRVSGRQPSRFISEIPGELFSAAGGQRPIKRRKPSSRQLSLFE